jgi:hypothetical protein
MRFDVSFLEVHRQIESSEPRRESTVVGRSQVAPAVCTSKTWLYAVRPECFLTINTPLPYGRRVTVEGW